MRKKTSRDEKRAEWQQKINDFQRSGLKASEFCRKNHAAIPTFRYWLHKLGRANTKSKVSFVELPMNTIQSAPPAGQNIQIIFPTGTRLVLDCGIDSENLVRLARAVQEAVC
jgi:hypothetical protein